MRSLRILAVALASAIVISPTPACADATSFVVVNAASGQPAPVARGAMVALLTDGPVSAETSRAYEPWVTATAGGLSVEATCSTGVMKLLPIAFVGASGRGHRIEVYLPNSLGPEPFGPCDDAGLTQFRLRPALGFGPIITEDAATVQGHPGIFADGDAPAGDHIDGNDGIRTALSICNSLVPQQSTACRVRTLGDPAVLEIRLTGAEMFICDPCISASILFELAPVTNGEVGEYTQQFLMSLLRESTGIEKARIMLNADTPAGEFRLRVRNTVGREFPAPLTVKFGQPT